MRFTKMHGLGNDYVYVNGFEEQRRRSRQRLRGKFPIATSASAATA